MKFIKSSDLSYVPVSHEDPTNPGALKKILFAGDDIKNGQTKVVNWAKIPAGKSFRPHYHEGMNEIFIVVSGEVEVTVEDKNFSMRKGDALYIEAREKHSMKNTLDQEVEYITIGIVKDATGKTVVVGA